MDFSVAAFMVASAFAYPLAQALGRRILLGGRRVVLRHNWPLAWLLVSGCGLVALLQAEAGFRPWFAALGCLLVALAIADIGYRLLPDVLVAAVAGLGFAWRLVDGGPEAVFVGLGGAALYGGLYAIVAAAVARGSGRAGGLGDVKLTAALAVWLPPGQLPLFLLASSLGFLAFQAVLWWRGDPKWNGPLPFGPMLIAAAAGILAAAH